MYYAIWTVLDAAYPGGGESPPEPQPEPLPPTGGSYPYISKEKEYTKEFTKFIIEQDDELLLIIASSL